MKILFLNYEYPPLGGGAGNATAYLLREYAQIPDLEVHLVTSSVDGAYHHFPVGERVTAHSVPIGKNASNLHYQSLRDLLAYTWHGYRFADKMLSQAHFDAIHAFFTVPCGFMAKKLGEKYGLPYIVSLRGADVPGFSERFSFLYAALKPLIRLVWKRAFEVVSASTGLKKLALMTLPSQKMSVIPNGISTEEFFPSANKEEDGYLRILCVSRITPRKGIRYLIEAVALLRKKHPEQKVELWIVGEGDELETLRELARSLEVEKIVKFFGRIQHDKLLSFYQVADIFCLPSHNEGMSNSLLEALAAGMPLLATVTGGTEELLTDGVNGYFIKMRSAQDIAEKIEVLAFNQELLKRFAAASRKRAEEMSWKNVATQYVDVYRKMIA